MAAERYKIQLRQGGGSPLIELETNIDPHDHRAVRALLEELVQQEKRTLDLDLSRFQLWITRSGSSAIEVKVTDTGRTTVDGKTAEDLVRR